VEVTSPTSEPAGGPLGRFGHAERIGLAVGAAVFVAAMAISQAYFVYLEDRAADRLEAVSFTVVSSVHERLIEAERTIAAGAGLFAASEEVSAVEFGRYVETVRLPSGMHGLGVVAVTRDEELLRPDPAQARELRLLGGAPEAGGIAFPVVMYHDGTPVPSPAARFPLGDPARERRALHQAVATGSLAVTPLMDYPELGEAGFMLAFPAEQMDGRIRRVVVGAVGARDLVGSAVGYPLSDQVAVSFGNLAENPPPLTSRLATARTVRVAGQQWWVHVAPTPGSPLSLPDWDRPLFLVSSILLGLFAGLAGYAVRRRRDTLHELADTVRLNAARDQFLGAVSHEIRTPLTAVVGFTDELRTGWQDFDDVDRAELLRLIHEQSQEVTALVHDLLVVSRADIRTLHLSTADVPVADVVRRAIESLPSDERQRIDDRVDGAWVHADPGRAAQIVRNLLVNAVQYGGETITVETHAEPERVRLRVVDDGPGIPEAHAEAVFDAYVNVPTGRQALPSIGLGLYVARRLAELMDGSLGYRREGEHTVFELDLPAATIPASARALPVG
jgi:signal transduction histidine kinase